MKTKLARFDQGYHDFPHILMNTIRHMRAETVCEIGVGECPILSEDFVAEQRFQYMLSDKEKPRIGNDAFPGDFRQIDWEAQKISAINRFDIVCSQMVLEHIQQPVQLHTNVHRALKGGGLAVHFFATHYSIASILNGLLPEYLTRWLIRRVQQRDLHQHDKFKAYYRQCFGPRKSAIRFFESLNFEIVLYNGYFGHNYLQRWWLGMVIERWFNRLFQFVDSPLFCSTAIVVLRKKTDALV